MVFIYHSLFGFTLDLSFESSQECSSKGQGSKIIKTRPEVDTVKPCSNVPTTLLRVGVGGHWPSGF